MGAFVRDESCRSEQQPSPHAAFHPFVEVAADSQEGGGHIFVTIVLLYMWQWAFFLNHDGLTSI